MKIKFLAAFVVAASLFLWASGRICGGDGGSAGPGPVNDAFFDADMAFYTRVLTDPTPTRPSPLHGLMNVVYRPATRLMARALGGGPGGDPRRDVLAIRILLAAVAALGIVALVRIAGQVGLDDRRLLVLVSVGLLATSNVIACVPESYGLSFGLLAIWASIILTPLEPARKAVLLAIGAVLCGGTTITNIVYPGGAFLYLFLLAPDRGGLRPRWLTNARIAAAAVVPILAVAAFLPLARARFTKFYEHIFSYIHLNLFRHPGRALVDGLHDLMFPVVAAYPYAGEHRITFGVPDGIAWTWVHLAAAIAWGAWLALGLAEGLRDAALRTFTLGLVGWIGFNLLLHSIWGGPDHGLYMPHWSWALVILAMIGSRRIPLWAVVALGAPIVAAQVMTLRFILHAVPIMAAG